MNEELQRIREAYKDYDREVTISKFKVGCVLGMILVPSFLVVDSLVYPNKALTFLVLRLLCSATIGVFLAVLLTRFGRRNYRFFGVTLVLIPAALISYMVYATEGPGSPYYAGLNLVLLVVGFVVNWTFRESLVAVSLVVAMYLAACFLPGAGRDTGMPDARSFPTPAPASGEGVPGSAHGPTGLADRNIFANNFFFLIMTGVIVVTGTYYLSQFRYREFALRYQLDKDRRKLEETNRRLTELDQLKSQFFANVSHELRTPLTLLLAPLETLLHRTQPPWPEAERQLLVTMHTNGMRLLKLLIDLLDLVRLEAGRSRVQLEPVEVEAFVRGLVSNVQHTAATRNLQVEVVIEGPCGTALLDPDKLERVLLNLLFNSLKFTPPGGRVELRVRVEPDTLVFLVADTGVGIATEHLSRIFDRFWQADASSRRQHQGLGIGLALAKELTQEQGGQITVASGNGRGSTFTVRLPHLRPGAGKPAEPAPSVASPNGRPARAVGGPGSVEWLTGLYRRAELFPAIAAAAIAPPAELPLDASRPTVLIADDEPDMLRFVGTQLAGQFNVIQASNGRQAVEQAVAHRPDLTVLDMMMPDLDGLEACREIRHNEGTRDLPIILLTARADEETKLAALAAGANDFLTKPFSTLELQLRVRNLVDNHRLQLELTRKNERLAETIDLLKETEVQLIQTEKLASLGRLSAGIIHEINNPLNFATTGLFSLHGKERHLDPGQRADFREILSDVEEGIRRVQNIVTDLRSFTHPGAGPAEDVRVVEAARMALRFLSHEWKDEVSVDVELPELLTVRANRNKLVQVFVNLLQNSLDAIQLKRFEGSDRPGIRIAAETDADHTTITVRDNGPGIDPGIRDQIFDPFFTTKEIGRGLGLGLSISFRILQEYGARLSVRSEPGAFCEFALIFPRVTPGAAETPSAPDS